MRFVKYIVAALAVLGLAGAVQAAPWKAAGPWAADYGDDYCALGRVFSDGKNQMTFMLERTQPGPWLRLIMIGDGVKPFRRASTWGVKFGPAGQSWKAPILQSKTGAGQAYYDLGQTTVIPFTPPAPGKPPVFKPYDRGEERTLAKSLTDFELSEGLTEPVEFDTGALSAPVGALQDCVADLVASWGLDAKRHETLTRPATPDGAAYTWIPNGTYPFTEFQKLQGGRNTIRVLIDAAGKPTNCAIQRATVSESINKTACDGIMKNGKFLPALDSAGQPMPSYWITEVFGLMPPFGKR